MFKKLLSLLLIPLVSCILMERIYSNSSTIISHSLISNQSLRQDQDTLPYKYYNFTFKDKTVTYTGETFYLEPNNVPFNVTVKYDRNGFINAGSYIVKAFFYSKNNTLISTKSARLTIDKARITGLTLRKKEVTYDGNVHKLEITGDIPEGVTATYTNNTQTNAGVYKMSVRLSGRNYITSTRSNTLTILPLDISKTISLQSKSFTYDGTPKSLFIQNPLPKGLNVTYKGNNQKEIGNHIVTATITGSKNYTPIPYEISATITITDEDNTTELPKLDQVIFENTSTSYTGDKISLLATNLPEGVTVKYNKNDYITVGTYEIKATFYYKNILLGTKSATLTIEKARITGVTLNKMNVIYNGEPHTLLLKGDLPEGVTATYTNNTHTNAGEYKVTVKLISDNYIASTRTNTLTITPIDLIPIIEFKSQSFKYDGVIRFLKISSDIPKGLKVSYKNNGQNTIGNHIVEATISGNSNYSPMPYKLSATLSITKEEEELPSLDKVLFEHKTEAYTGEPITIEATNLPEGVTVKYNKNSFINIGEYQIIASFYYKEILLGTKIATLTIEKARITGIKFSKKEVIYDGKEHELLLEGDLPSGVTAVYKNNKGTNAGEYKASVTLTGDNYITSTRTNILTILSADITKLVELKSESYIYDGKEKTLIITGDVPKELTLTYDNNKHTKVGNYTVKATLSGSSNYSPMPYTMSATLSITKDEEELPSLDKVIFENKTEVYTGEPITIEATNLPESVTVKYNKNSFINTGEYQIIASFYYKEILLGTRTATLTIEKARITTVKFSKKEVIYDGKEHELLLEGDLPNGVTAVYKNNKGTNAGEYKASVTLTGDNYITSTRTNILTILPADITKLVELKSESYVYDGKEKSLIVSGDVPKELTLTYENNKHTEVGNYTVKATLSGSNNYTPMPYAMSATLSITKDEEELPSLDKVIFEHKTETYTGEVISIEATNIPDNVITKYDNNSFINSGTYQVIASFYFKEILLGTRTATLTIEKARITTVKFSKKEVIYDGKEHELLLEGDLPNGVTAVYKNNKGTNAGEYKASVTLTGDNYITSTRTNILTILPADITKLVELKSESYIYDGKEKALVVSGDVPKELTLTYENNKHTKVGNYTVKATLSGSNNYSPIPYTMSATLSITKDEEELPSLDKVIFEHKTETYTGKIISIEATNIPDKVITKYDNNSFINSGTYQIIASFYYKEILLGTKTATLTIEKARITTVKFSKKEVIYDGKEHEITLEGDLPDGVIAVYKNNKGTNAGEYKASVTLTGDNYITSTRTNILTILPADITKMVELKSESYVYDGKEKSLTVSGDIPKELTLTYENNKHTKVGNYTVKATLSGSNNYSPIPYMMSATLSINQKEEELPSLEKVIFEHKTETYTGEVISIEATNIPDNVIIKYDNNSFINSGTYQVTASFYFKEILLGTRTATLTIEKARITTVKFSKKEVIYNGKEHEIALEGDLPNGVTAVYKNNKGTNAGEYKASVTLTGDNYITSTRTNILTILPADITKLVELKSESYIYDGKEKSLTISGDVPKELTLTYENNKHTEIGNYTVKATLSGSNNYSPMPYMMSATLSITKDEEELPSLDKVIFEHKTETYTGEPITIEATNIPDKVITKYDNNSFINSGVYQVIASFYFKEILLGTKTATLTIEKARITTVKFSKKEVIYNGKEHEIALEGDLPNGVTAVYKNNKGTNAGEYKASVTLTGDNYITSTRTNILTILPSDITKLVELKSKSFKYDSKEKTLVVSGDIPKELTLTYENNKHTDVGNYTVKATLSGSTNYTPMPYTMSATLSITKDEEELPSLDKVRFNDKTAIYTGLPYKIEAANIPSNVTVSYSDNSFTSVGIYTITATFYYKTILLGTKRATLTIEKARIENIKFSKKEVIYNGNEHQLLLEGELPNGVTALYKNNKGTNAGEYKATVTLSGENYITSTRTNILTILPADITKLVELKSSSFKYDGKPKSLSVEGNVPDELKLSYENNSHTDKGTYIVKATLSGSTNYSPMPYVMIANLHITEEEIDLPNLNNVIFANKKVIYTGNSHKLEAINLPSNVIVEYDRNYYENAGEYLITASFYYNSILLGKKTASLIIEKAKLTNITFSKQTVDYNGKPHYLLIKGKLPKGVSATYENNVHTDAGTYKASVTLEGDNYVTSKRTTTLTINPISIGKLISFKDQAYIYDGNPKTITITGNLPSPLKVTYENNTHTEIGTYQVKATIEGSSNYTPMPYIIVATLVIRSDDEAADIVQLSINDQVYKDPQKTITYTLPCGENSARINIDLLSEGAFVANQIKGEYLIYYPGTLTIPITVKSQTQTLINNYTIEIIKPIPFEKVALKKADNSFEVNMQSATNGGFNYTAFNWYRNDVLVSTKHYYIAGANSDQTDNTKVKHRLVLITDKGEKVYTCEQVIEIDNTDKIKLYPNPVDQNKIIYIAFDMDKASFTGASMEIYTILGNRIFETELLNRENQIKLPTHFQAGKYITIILINGQKKVINLIIK